MTDKIDNRLNILWFEKGEIYYDRKNTILFKRI